MDDFKDMEESFEIKALQKKVAEQKAEIEKLRQVIKDNDLEDEIEDAAEMSDAEFICVKGLEHLKKLYDTGTFEKTDTVQVKTLVETLRMIRGQSSGDKKGGKPLKTNDVGKLLEIAKGGK